MAQSFFVGILPIVLFRAFMLLTDQHTGRSPEPFGNKDFISELSSFLVPAYGPLSAFLSSIVGAFPRHFEGYSYLGLGINLLLILSIPVILFFYKYIRINKGIFGLLVASAFFLLFSFGIQYKLQEIFGLKILALNQFRAMGRFSWFAYYVLPLVIFHLLFELINRKYSSMLAFRTINILALFYLGFNLYEGDAYFKIYDGVIWEDRNVFNSKLLNEEEKHLLEAITTNNTQAILPLPTFYIGSEIYERSTPTNPMFLSSIFSYHSGLPIVSSCMSRTSVTETRSAINLLNSYQKKNYIVEESKRNTFFVIRTQDPLFEDEKRVWKKTQHYANNDSIQFGFIKLKDLQNPILDSQIVEIKNKTFFSPNSKTIIYLGAENRKP